MAELSQEKEQAVVMALTNFETTGWMSSWGESYDIISAHCGCSAEEAESILEDLYPKRAVIVYVPEHSTPVEPPSYRWVRNKK